MLFSLFKGEIREKLCTIPGKILDDITLQTLIGETTKQLDFVQQQIEEGEVILLSYVLTYGAISSVFRPL